jgi:hypothetical protein
MHADTDAIMLICSSSLSSVGGGGWCLEHILPSELASCSCGCLKWRHDDIARCPGTILSSSHHARQHPPRLPPAVHCAHCAPPGTVRYAVFGQSDCGTNKPLYPLQMTCHNTPVTGDTHKANTSIPIGFQRCAGHESLRASDHQSMAQDVGSRRSMEHMT